MSSGHKLDSQQVELIGTALLKSLLLADGIEVAEPIRDRGIDLLAYLDLGYFRAVPIQVKAYSQARFGVDRKYEKFPELRIVHLWNVQDPQGSEVFCTTAAQAADIAGYFGWTSTKSWEGGKYSTAVNPKTAAGQKVIDALSPFRVSTGGWHGALFGLHAAVPHSDEMFEQGTEHALELSEGPASYRVEQGEVTLDEGRTTRVLVDIASSTLWIRKDTIDGEPNVPDLSAGDRFVFRSHDYVTLTATPSGFIATRHTPGERLVIERDR